MTGILSNCKATDPRLHRDPTTLIIFSDLNCSFAHLAMYRLHQTRSRLGLDSELRFEHRAFPLELFNRSVNERPGIDSEVAVVGALEPRAGWRLWQGPDWNYPVTMLPALEAVQAATAQGWHAGEQLDLALRRGSWTEGRCILNVMSSLTWPPPGRSMLIGWLRPSTLALPVLRSSISSMPPETVGSPAVRMCFYTMEPISPTRVSVRAGKTADSA